MLTLPTRPSTRPTSPVATRPNPAGAGATPAALPTSTAVQFYFDPACPWTWITSRWVVEVAGLRDMQITWQLFSLRFHNKTNPGVRLDPGRARRPAPGDAGPGGYQAAPRQRRGRQAVHRVGCVDPLRRRRAHDPTARSHRRGRTAGRPSSRKATTRAGMRSSRNPPSVRTTSSATKSASPSS